MSYSMSYTWYDVTCNVGICKSKSTLCDTSYHIRRMTGWALSYCGMRVAGCALYHKVVLHCDVTPRYAVTSLRVKLSRDFSPERHPAIRYIHVKSVHVVSEYQLCFRTEANQGRRWWSWTWNAYQCQAFTKPEPLPHSEHNTSPSTQFTVSTIRHP